MTLSIEAQIRISMSITRHNLRVDAHYATRERLEHDIEFDLFGYDYVDKEGNTPARKRHTAHRQFITNALFEREVLQDDGLTTEQKSWFMPPASLVIAFYTKRYNF